MRTVDARAVRRLMDGHEVTATVPVPVDVVDALQSIAPILERVRRREFAILVTGARDARDRDAVAVFTARLFDLVDALEARR